MRGRNDSQTSMVCLLSPEEMVPATHPLRGIKKLADEALKAMEGAIDAMYASNGRPSIPPERLLKSLVLQALFGVRSERQLTEQVHYNLLYRWFLDMSMTESVWDRTVFSHNRVRLLEHEVAYRFFREVVELAKKDGLMSEEHFSVDSSLIEAWGSMKSFRPKTDNDDEPPGGSNRWTSWHGTKRSNDTHESRTDPDAKLMRKGRGKEAKLSHSLHALMENRNGLLVDLCVDDPRPRSEPRSAERMLERSTNAKKRRTVGGDKGYDQRVFVSFCRGNGMTPHVAQRRKGSAIDGRTTSWSGYVVSQRIRKRIEEIFGWVKTSAGFRKSRFRGRERTELFSHLVGAAYNLLRIAKHCET